MSILVNTGFEVGSAEPLDKSSIKETVADRDALVTAGLVYEGMKVYCKDTKLEYRYTGAGWDEIGSGTGSSYDDTEVRALINTNKTDIATNTTNITELTTKIGTETMDTTATDITGAIKEVNGNLLGDVTFSADYKNIVLNRKNGTNPYTIPIAAIINHAKLIELADVDVTDIGNGKILIYDAATQKHKYVDSTGTDELVKMDATADAHYLVDLIDKQTVVNDNGVLKVKMLDGQDVTITEINFLKGLTMNVMDLVNTFANGGVKVLNTPVATYADLTTLDRSTFLDGISYIVYVLADETHAGAKTTYLCDKTSSTYFGNADSQRNFTTNPIDLANEVTGKLPVKNIDVDSLWALLTVDDTYKTLTDTDKAFGTHGAKAMYDELVAGIGAKANQTDFDTHKDDTTIHITQDEKDSYLKKTDADGKFATITAVDGKVDKTELDKTNANLGVLSELKTTEKTNLVGAINEVAESCGNIVISSQILTPLFSNQSENKVFLYKMGKLRMISPTLVFPSSRPVMTYFDAYQLPEDSYPPRKMNCLMNADEGVGVDLVIEESGKIQMRYRGNANYVWIPSLVWLVN